MFIGIKYAVELNMLCDYVTRGYGDHPLLTIAASVERRRRSAWGGAAAGRPVFVCDVCVCVYYWFFDCGWALFGNRVAGKRPRGSQCILNTG